MYYTNIKDTKLLFEMVSLLGACGFKLHGLFILFYQVFVCDVFSKESIIFNSFHKKVWRYDDVITISWQNQGIIIVYCIFLKCLNKVSWEILYTTKINKFLKKKKKKDTSCIMSSYRCSGTTLPYLPKKWCFTKILI